MIRALIVEDELYIRKGFIAMLDTLDFDIDILGECESVKDATIVTNACKPDLVFLDINLTDGTGFEFLENTKDLNFKVIFITAYEEYALKALKNGAVDYILKPVDINELELAIKKATQDTQNNKNNYTIVKEQLIDNKNERLVLKLQEGYQIIYISELMNLKSDKGYTTFFLKNDKSFIASKSIKEYESQLPTTNFIRVHQSHIINMNFIDRYDKTGYIYLKSGEIIPVSSRKKELFLNKLMNE